MKANLVAFDRKHDHQFAVTINVDRLGPVEFKLDLPSVCAGIDDEVVFKLPLISVVGNVDAFVNVAVTYLAKVRHVGLPLGAVTDQIIAAADEFVLSDGGRCRVATFQMQPHGVVGVSIGHAQHGVAVAQKDCVTAAACQKVDRVIGLSEILFERQRRAEVLDLFVVFVFDDLVVRSRFIGGLITVCGRCIFQHRRVERSDPFSLRRRVEGDNRFNVAEFVFKVPVSAEDRVPGVVIRGRNVGTRQSCQRVDQILPTGTASQIATVKQQVRIRRKRGAPASDLAHVSGQIVLR